MLLILVSRDVSVHAFLLVYFSVYFYLSPPFTSPCSYSRFMRAVQAIPTEMGRLHGDQTELGVRMQHLTSQDLCDKEGLNLY